MANLNGHEAGNGGYGQGEPNATAPVLYSTETPVIPEAEAVYLAEGRYYCGSFSPGGRTMETA